MVGPWTIAWPLVAGNGRRSVRIEHPDLPQATWLGRGRDRGQEAPVGPDEQSAVEPQLDLDPSPRERPAAGSSGQLEERPLEADGAVRADRASPAERQHPGEVHAGGYRAPG
jgi:hypothetical protein